MKRANKTSGHDSEHVMTWSKLMHLLCETQSCVKNGVFCFDSPPVSSDQEAFLELPRFFSEGRLKISGKMDMKYGRFLVVKGPGTIQANIAAQEPVVRGMPKVDAVIVLMDGAKLVNTSKKSLRDGHVRYFIGKGCDVEFKNCDVKAADMHEFVTYDLQRTLDHAGNQSKEKIEKALRKRVAEAFVPYARSGIDDVYCGAGPGIDPSQYFLSNGTFEKVLGVSRLDEAV